MSHRVTSLDQKSPRGLHKTRRCGSGREHIERCDRKKPPRPVTWRAKTEREGFEPPSPFGRSLSRRVQYHSASAPNSKARLPEGRPGGSLRASSSNSAFESGRYQKTAASGGTTNRGARIRTGDLCDPNAALYRTEPRPGTNSGQSMYGRVELTSLRSVVSRVHRLIASRPPSSPLGSNPLGDLLRRSRGFERFRLSINGRGGIRTHAGVSPHDFQSCALSHSATRPRPLVPRKGQQTTSAEGVGFEPTRCCHQRLSRAPP